MAIAGSAIPTYQVKLDQDRRKLDILISTLMPKSVVQCDMAMAADTLRANPDKMIRVDSKRYTDLVDLLRSSGEVK